jgi:ribosome biogenesis GTPase / thiamine phosphate phosphatase
MPNGVIVKALSGFYYVDDQERVVQCRARGIFKKDGINPLVGDQVVFTYVGSEGVVEKILPRSSELVRPPISNVTVACMFVSVKDPEVNDRLLDRMLVQAESQKIRPVICITKVDLDTEERVVKRLRHTYSPLGYEVLAVSGLSNIGVEQFKSIITGTIAVLTGQSGVGKSTVIQAMFPDSDIKMGVVSTKAGRGKHTTRHTELFRLDATTYVADTPGFSQLDVAAMEPEQLQFWFPEISEIRDTCEYRRCLHETEEGCAVRLSVEQNHIVRSRYDNYLSFLLEIREARSRRYS